MIQRAWAWAVMQLLLKPCRGPFRVKLWLPDPCGSSGTPIAFLPRGPGSRDPRWHDADDPSDSGEEKGMVMVPGGSPMMQWLKH